MLPKIKKTLKMFLLSEDGRISKQSIIKAGLLTSIFGIAGSIFAKNTNAADVGNSGNTYGQGNTGNDNEADHTVFSYCKYPADSVPNSGYYTYKGKSTPVDGKAGDFIWSYGNGGETGASGRCLIPGGNVACTSISHSNSLSLEKTTDEKLVATHAHSISKNVVETLNYYSSPPGTASSSSCHNPSSGGTAS
ncbi:hypothetical protein HY772_10015 [Candidatus Woesearchaeota archaeon]|nr:hypothetical protein [Candidatus Woesearchaeota archaeon]